MSSCKHFHLACEVTCGWPVETVIQNKVTYLFGNMWRPLPFLLWQEEGGHLLEEEIITQALLTQSVRAAVIWSHHLVFVMTNKQIGTSTFRYVCLVLIC